MENVVIGISGASGIILGYRTVDVLTHLGYNVELVITDDAHVTAAIEMEDSLTKSLEAFEDPQRARIRYHDIRDFTASIASGSYHTAGMIIIPCSMATLAAIAQGLSDNLLRRAADVTIKERRPLVVVPRETPLSAVHLENMLRIARLGGTIVPPVPGWYAKPKSLSDIEDFIVGRALDAIGIHTDIYSRWQ